MNTRNVVARAVAGLWLGFAIVVALVLSLGFAVGTLAASGGVSGPARLATEQRGAAPLKPDWVEALLDTRATARRSLLEARDLLAAPYSLLSQQAPGAAPLQPDWVEVLRDTRAIASRAMLAVKDQVPRHAVLHRYAHMSLVCVLAAMRRLTTRRKDRRVIRDPFHLLTDWLTKSYGGGLNVCT